MGIKREILLGIKKIKWFTFSRVKYFLTKEISEHKTISLVCISKRYKKIKNLLASIKKNTNNITNIELLLLVDKDDQNISKYRKILKKYKKNLRIRFFIKKFKKNTHKINFLANKSNHELISGVGDDIVLEKNWDKEILITANKFKKKDYFSIWPREKTFKYDYLHNNFPIINKFWLKKYGVYLDPRFHHYFADNYLCDICRKSKKFLITKKNIFSHTQVIGGQKIDDVIKKNLINLEKDKKTYEKLKKKL